MWDLMSAGWRRWLVAQSLPLVVLALGALVTARWPSLAALEVMDGGIFGVVFVVAYLYRVHRAAPMWLIPVMVAMFTLGADGAAAIPSAVAGHLGDGTAPALVIASACVLMLELAVTGAVISGERRAVGGEVPRPRAVVGVDYSPETWIPCPLTFEQDRLSWARYHATRRWARSGKEHRDPEVTNLAWTLIALHEQAYRSEDADDAFIHMPDLDAEPLLVVLCVREAEGAQLRDLAHADDPGTLLPPVVIQFTTEALGTGLRTLYYVRRERAVIATVAYAFWSQKYRTALLMRAASADPGRLRRALPDMDRLAHTMTVMPYGS